MAFNSLDYLIFFPIVVLLYYVIPGKLRMYWLLIASYYFYSSWNLKYSLLLLFATLITYSAGLAIELVDNRVTNNYQKRIKTIIVCISVAINIGLLVYYKYANFIVHNINSASNILGKRIHINELDIILPIGISFFVFQAVGYTIDVYRKSIQAEHDFFRYALFVSFFPQLVAGPIERSTHLLRQFKGSISFEYSKVRDGLLTIGYGLFIKMVAADNIALVIDPIFNAPEAYSGMALLFATILFAFQIYCDFNGYTQIAIGSARVLGIELNPNFAAPYMGCDVKDFWKRWHISLTSWFRDYLYIPLGGNRKGVSRKYINTLIVFLCSGLWHGAAWHYVIWGGLNGIFIITSEFTKPIKEKLTKLFSIDENRITYKVFRRMWTFLLIDFTWLFFRAPSLRTVLCILSKIKDDFRIAWFVNFEFASVFENINTLLVVLFSLLFVVIIDLMKYFNVDVKSVILRQQVVFRWAIYMALMLGILYWGVYGMGYEQTQFIYFQF